MTHKTLLDLVKHCIYRSLDTLHLQWLVDHECVVFFNRDDYCKRTICPVYEIDGCIINQILTYLLNIYQTNRLYSCVNSRRLPQQCFPY